MAVRTGAGAAAARLDPEQVVEERDDEVVVQVPAIMADRERHDREPRQRRVPEDPDARLVGPGGHGAVDEGLLERADGLAADALLELEREPRPDRLDDGRRPALLAVLRVGEVDVLERVHVDDRAAARRRGTRLRNSSRRATRTPGRARPADELVRATGRSRPCSRARRPARADAATSRSRRTARRPRSPRTRARRGGGAGRRWRGCPRGSR